LANTGMPLSLLNPSIFELKSKIFNLSMEFDPFRDEEDLKTVLSELIEPAAGEIKRFEQSDYVE
jgi:hypothetical protein